MNNKEKIKQLKKELSFLKKMEKVMADDAVVFPHIHIGDMHGKLIEVIASILVPTTAFEDLETAQSWIDVRINYLLNASMNRCKKESCRFIVLDLINTRMESGLFTPKQFAIKYAAYINVDRRFGRMYYQIYRTGTPDLKKLITENKITISNAAHISALSPDKQVSYVKKIRSQN